MRWRPKTRFGSDLIAVQGWFDLTQHQLDPPGSSMHCACIIDAPLDNDRGATTAGVDPWGREAITLFLLPTLLLAATLLLVAAIPGECAAGAIDIMRMLSAEPRQRERGRRTVKEN
jgi:hypothetical protein